MSYEAMLAVLSSELEKIRPITETPVPNRYTPDALTNAEDAIRDEKEKDKKEDDKYREEHKEVEEDEDNDNSNATDNDSSGTSGNTDTGDNDKSVAETNNELANFGAGASDNNDLANDMNNPDVSNAQLDAKLSELTLYERMTFQFIRSEYGSPSGSDSNLCPNCSGTADAADAAIIDNEVTKTERTEPFGSTNNNSGGGDAGGFGGDMGGGDFGGDFGGDMGGGYDFGNMSFKATFGVGTESIGMSGSDLEDGIDFAADRAKEIAYMAKSILSFGEKAFHFISKTTTTALHKIGHAVESNLLKIRHASKFYEYKLKTVAPLIQDAKLAEFSTEAFTAKDWVTVVGDCHEIYKLLCNISKQMTCPYDKFSEVIDLYKAAFAKINVDIMNKVPSACLKELYARRQNASLVELGYNPRDMFNILRHLEQLADISDNDAMGKITKAIQGYGKVLDLENKTLIKKLKDTNNVPEELQKKKNFVEMDTKKYDFLISVIEVYVDLTTRLVDDVHDVCYLYEKSIIPEYIRG